MKKLISTLLLAGLVLLCLPGCAQKGSLASLDAVPPGAQLVFTQDMAGSTGVSVTYGSWQIPSLTGSFIVDVTCRSGKLSGMSIENQLGSNAGTIASFGDLTTSRILQSESITFDQAQFNLHFSRLQEFEGKIEIYFLPG